MTGLRFLSRASDGSIMLATYHPASCPTWHWSVSLKRMSWVRGWRWSDRAARRTHQWHDFYRLAFGWWLVVSQQDYHRATLNDRSADK